MADHFNDEQNLSQPEGRDPAERDLGASFADPNTLDDKRMGKSFAETNSSAKKKLPIADLVHAPRNRKPLYIGLLIFAIVFVAVLLIGGLPKFFRNSENNERSEHAKNTKPVVEAERVHRATSQAGLALPGTTIPLNQAYIYARASGYLKSYKVDIGDRVKKNQLLAIIEAPDLDAQVSQARQQVQQAEQQLEQQKSQLTLATVTVQRYRVLVAKGVLSRQQGDQEEATYGSQVANVAAAERNVEAYKSNLDRMITLQGYEYVRAPFDGVITQRNVDIGALIATGGQTSSAIAGPAPQGQTSSSGGTSQPAQSNSSGTSGSSSNAATTSQSPGQGGALFGIAQLDKLRVLVSVPEEDAPFMHPGEQAQLSFQEFPGVPFTGLITRTSNSVDQNTRTMLTEVQVDNRAGKLIPGMYTVAVFPPAAGEKPPLVISGDAVIMRNDHSSLAVIRDGVVHITPVTVGRDFGTSIEILTGVQEGELIAAQVTDDVVEGAQVQVQEASAQKTAHSESNP